MFYSEKNQVVRLNIFCTMCLCIILFSATVIGDNQDDYSSHTEETLEFHIQRPPNDLWYHSREAKDIPADVEHTHPAQTHTHKNYYGDEDENGDPTETFPEHTHAAYTHAAHNKAHYRPGASGHTPHNSDDLHSHDYIIDYEKTLSHVHPSDTSHMGGRAHSHPGWWHWHGDGEELHEDHDADGEHTHPPISVLGPISTAGHALPYRHYRGYNGYTHTHPDPAFEAHKAENPPHTDHKSFVQHTHNGQTHSHDDYPSHTHNGITHTHLAEIDELNEHKQTSVVHSNHKSFVEHTHDAQPHSHDDYPSHTHNGITHTHQAEIDELNQHTNTPVSHSDHKSFVEHTHDAQPHSHDDYPSHTHNGITHTHQAEINELEAHRQQRLPHVEHAATGEHEHTAQTHQHDEYPPHTHVGYSHTHPTSPEVVDVVELNRHANIPVVHSDHKSFVQHKHVGQTHSHGKYPSHTHAGITHTHQAELSELNRHKQKSVVHNDHKSFVEHTHAGQTHSHDGYPSHTHAGITHTHQAEINELETHRQQRLPHGEHTTTGEHEHTAQTHQHDAYPSHTHVSYIHTHPIQPQPEPVPQPEPDLIPTPQPEPVPVPVRDAYIPVKGELEQIIFSEFMFESIGGLHSLPQWIEVYNTTATDINLRDWQLEWYRRKPILLNTTIKISDDFIIPANQTRLIVSIRSRHSGGNLGEETVYNLFSYHSIGLQQNDDTNRNRLIAREGFYLKLLDGEGTLIDQIGTLKHKGTKQNWELPECLIDGIRTSLIRRFDKGVPRSGISKKSWIRAYDTKAKHTGIWYGRNTDIGTPGYKSDDTPLPVQLSAFSARMVDGKVIINWTTESELNNAGFNILRSTSPTKNFQVLNTRVIEGTGTTGERSTYQYVDYTAKPNVAYYYRIEDIDFAGTRRILTTQQLRDVISPTNKFIITWSELKDGQ